MTTRSEATQAARPLDRRVSHQTFLGREHFDSNTRMWTFSDGSGAVPEEMRQDMLDATEMRVKMKDGEWSGNGVFVLGTLFAWKDRLGL